MAVNVVIKNVQFKTYRTDELIINPHCPLIEFLSFHWWRTDYKDALAQSFLLPVLVLQSFGGFLENFPVLVWVWFGFLLLSVSVLLSCPPLLLSATWVTFLLFPCFFVSSFVLGLQFVCFFYLHRPSNFALSSCDWKQQQYFSTKPIKLTNLKVFF